MRELYETLQFLTRRAQQRNAPSENDPPCHRSEVINNMEGIAQDRYGWRVYAKVGSRQREKRYPKNTPLDTLIAKRDEMRHALRIRAQIDIPTTGTLRHDGPIYLQRVKPVLAKSSYASRVCELEAWYPDLGDRTRASLTREDILRVRQRWLTAAPKPVAVKTVMHRERVLKHLYRYLDGKHARTPLDDLPRLTSPPANPQFVDVRTIKAVASKLTNQATRGRFMVLASTGQRPAQLKRALPGDVDLRRRLWLVRPAKAGNPIPVVLTDDMVAAFRVFKAANAWGAFDSSDYAKALYAAGWPRHIRPYNAKHTVAIALARSDAQWEDIKDWFGHKDIKTTRIYTGQVLKRLQRTSQRLAGRIGW